MWCLDDCWTARSMHVCRAFVVGLGLRPCTKPSGPALFGRGEVPIRRADMGSTGFDCGVALYGACVYYRVWRGGVCGSVSCLLSVCLAFSVGSKHILPWSKLGGGTRCGYNAVQGVQHKGCGKAALEAVDVRVEGQATSSW